MEEAAPQEIIDLTHLYKNRLKKSNKMIWMSIVIGINNKNKTRVMKEVRKY